MPRAVLDANVYVSAVLSSSGAPGRVIDAFLRGESFALVMSAAIVDEVIRALSYPKVRKLIHASVDPEAWFEDLVVLADMVESRPLPSPVCTGPDDDKYLAAAIEGRCEFVVSGDGGLLAVREHVGVRIMTPRAFIDLLQSRRTG